VYKLCLSVGGGCTAGISLSSVRGHRVGACATHTAGHGRGQTADSSAALSQRATAARNNPGDSRPWRAVPFGRQATRTRPTRQERAREEEAQVRDPHLGKLGMKRHRPEADIGPPLPSARLRAAEERPAHDREMPHRCGSSPGCGSPTSGRHCCRHRQRRSGRTARARWHRSLLNVCPIAACVCSAAKILTMEGAKLRGAQRCVRARDRKIVSREQSASSLHSGFAAPLASHLCKHVI